MYVIFPSLFLWFQAQNPDVWYGIGLLYDRYASFDHAEEAFSNVLYIDPNHRKRSEIYFRLGIIYKQQKKYRQSIDVSNRLHWNLFLYLSVLNTFWKVHQSL